MGRAIAVVLFVAVLATPACAFDWEALVPQTGTAAVVSANGLNRMSLTVTWELVRYQDLKIDADAMIANDASTGFGVSVGLSPIATWTGVRKSAPFVADVLDRIYTGPVLLHSGPSYDAGWYVKLSLAEVRF